MDATQARWTVKNRILSKYKDVFKSIETQIRLAVYENKMSTTVSLQCDNLDDYEALEILITEKYRDDNGYDVEVILEHSPFTEFEVRIGWF